MNMCSIWISHTIIVLSLFNADLVIGQINNVLSGARFNITLKFIPNENAILWIRETANLRDASVNTTTGSDCGNPFIPTPAGLNFYCEDSGGTYILELDGSDSDQGIVYTSDPPPSQSFEYAVIDKDHTAAINYTRIPENFTLTEPITLSCTVTCTLQDTSITVYVKQNDTTLHQLNSASNTVNCSSVGFQTITESSDLTLDAVRSLNITEPFNIVFNISHRGRFLTRKTATIIVSSGIPGPEPPDCPLLCISIVTICGVLVVIGCIVFLCYYCGGCCFGKNKKTYTIRIVICMVVIAVIVICCAVAVFIKCTCCFAAIIAAAVEVTWSIVCLICCCVWCYCRAGTMETSLTNPPSGKNTNANNSGFPPKPEGPLEIVESNKTPVPLGSICIHWKRPKNDGCLAVTGYIIEFRDMKGKGWEEVKSVSAKTLTCVVDKLTEGASYMFQVSAKNAIGRGEALVSDGAVKIRSKPEAPAPPCKLRYSKIMYDSVTLEWVAPFDNGGSPLTGYVIEFKDSKWNTLPDIDADVNCHDVPNLKPNVKYYFKISAKNAVGRSEPATLDNPVTVKTKGINETSLNNPPSGNNTNANNSGLPEYKRAPKIGQTPESPDKKTTSSPARPLPKPSKSSSKSEQNITPRPLPQSRQQPLPPIKSNSKY